jgi:stearoyl-CoA desaturase (Delta-9 desaturase)
MEPAMSTILKPAAHQEESHHDDSDVVYPGAIPFLLVHLVCGAAYWTGITTTSVMIALFFYWLRMFAIGGGYHRYFSHRSYKTNSSWLFWHKARHRKA